SVERDGLDRQALRPHPASIGQERGELDGVRKRIDLGNDSLVRAGDEAVPGSKRGLDASVFTGPVGVLAEETEAPRNEEPHDAPLRRAAAPSTAPRQAPPPRAPRRPRAAPPPPA